MGGVTSEAKKDRGRGQGGKEKDKAYYRSLSQFNKGKESKD